MNCEATIWQVTVNFDGMQTTEYIVTASDSITDAVTAATEEFSEFEIVGIKYFMEASFYSKK